MMYLFSFILRWYINNITTHIVNGNNKIVNTVRMFGKSFTLVLTKQKLYRDFYLILAYPILNHIVIGKQIGPHASFDISQNNNMASFNIFGRAPKKVSKAEKPKSMAESMKVIDDTIKQNEKRESHLNTKIMQQLKLAKAKSNKGDKRGAILCLKRKKMYQAEVDKINNILANLEQQKFALENAATNAVVVGGMSAAKSALQQINKDMDVDTVTDVMDDIQEQMDMGEEISNALGQQMGDTMDDDELLGELDDMEKDLMAEEMLKDAGVVENNNIFDETSLPNVPNEKPKAQEDLDEDEEAAFNNLMAEME
jgi:charged multivesicular body protein 4A/B